MTEISSEDLSPGAERRRQQRLPIRGSAIVRIQRREIHADAVDISADGVCLTLPHTLEVGSTCQLELQVHGASKRSTSVVARVCFCLQGKAGYRVGLNCSLEEFVDDFSRLHSGNSTRRQECGQSRASTLKEPLWKP